VEQSNYAVGWGTLALIDAGLAQSRRRSGGRSIALPITVLA
jgi:hypothetical protein